jgi:hypothetical protein
MANENRWEWDVKVGDMKPDVGGEYTLPDYLPEVKRVLRTDLAVFPDGQYVRDGAVVCGGRVRYYVFYTAQDGALTVASLEGEYTGEIPVEEGSEVVVYVRSEGASCRPLGPRKLSLKANICLHPTEFIAENASVSLPEEAGRLEQLIKSTPCAHTNFVRSADIPIAQTIHLGGPCEVLAGDGHVLVRGVKCEDEGIRVSGETWVSLMLRAQDGAPRTQRVKIPFEEYIPCEGARAESQAMLRGNIRDLNLVVGESDDGHCLAIDAILTFTGMVAEHTHCETLVDAYSLTHPLEVSHREMRSRTYPAISTGSFTIDGSEERGSMECRGADSILDVRADAVGAVTTCENGELVTQGTLRATGIACGEGGYMPISMQIPFKVRMPFTPCEEMGELLCEPFVECVGANAHFEGEHITIQAELNCTVVARTEGKTRIVDAITVEDGEYEKDACVRAVYLTDNDSLWSVAKRYHVPMGEVAEDNSLPDEALENPDAPYMLDGLTRLVIR